MFFFLLWIQLRLEKPLHVCSISISCLENFLGRLWSNDIASKAQISCFFKAFEESEYCGQKFENFCFQCKSNFWLVLKNSKQDMDMLKTCRSNSKHSCFRRRANHCYTRRRSKDIASKTQKSCFKLLKSQNIQFWWEFWKMPYFKVKSQFGLVLENLLNKVYICWRRAEASPDVAVSVDQKPKIEFRRKHGKVESRGHQKKIHCERQA